MIYDFISMKCQEQANLEKQKADQWLPRAGGIGGKWGVKANEYSFLWGKENILKADCGDGFTTL